MIEVADLVQWNVLTLHPNDLATIYERIKDGRRLDDVPVTIDTILQTHTGMVEKIEEGFIVVIDFVGRCTQSFAIEEAYDKLTLLNRK